MKQTFLITITIHNSDVKNIWTIDFDDTENYYIVKNDEPCGRTNPAGGQSPKSDKVIKTTKKGVQMLFFQIIKNSWYETSDIEFKCSELEKCFFADSFFKDNKHSIKKKLIFFLEFQMETF
jgi:hypothetical protein